MQMKKLLLSAALLCATSLFAAKDGHVSLFDGKSLDNWDGDPKFWSVQDGAITGITTKDNPTKGNTFIIYTGKEKFTDFELQMDF